MSDHQHGASAHLNPSSSERVKGTEVGGPAGRRGDRWIAVHVGDAAQRGELATLGPTSSIRPTAMASSLPCVGARRNQEGEVNDVRFVKDGVARALRTLRTATKSGAGRPRGAVVGADGWTAVRLSRTGSASPASRTWRTGAAADSSPARSSSRALASRLAWPARHARGGHRPARHHLAPPAACAGYWTTAPPPPRSVPPRNRPRPAERAHQSVSRTILLNRIPGDRQLASGRRNVAQP